MLSADHLLLIGPGLRCERPVHECRLRLDPRERAVAPARFRALAAVLTTALPDTFRLDLPPDSSAYASPGAMLAFVYVRVAIALQHAAGHEVEDCGFDDDRAGDGTWAWFEYEHDEVAERAAELALQLVTDAVRQLQSQPVKSAASRRADVDAFIEWASARVLSPDAATLVEAARRRGIPCQKLERDPYNASEGDFRVRPHSLLMFGHCGRRRIVDGTLCVTRNAALHALLKNAALRRSRLSSAGLPMRSRTRRSDPRDSATLENRLLCLADRPLALIGPQGEQPLEALPPSVRACLPRIRATFDPGLYVIRFGISADRADPIVADIDFAPEIDRLFPFPEARRLAFADAFLDWLYPDADAEIPVFAVTGTNGKTTTCRMLGRILKQAGHHVGMVCSDGVYFGERFEATRGEIGPAAHHRVLEHESTDAAVFEEYFGRIRRLGFAWQYCDIAVCTNVTEDHLGRLGIHEMAQLARLKFEVVRRARYAVVLNADNDWTLDMARRTEAERICLVSMNRSLEDEMAGLGRRGCRCVLETFDGRNWGVMHDLEQTEPLVAVDDIPATFDGRAGFNVANALHAAAAAWMHGVDPDTIAEALRSFAMSREQTPGRINRYQRLPFDVFMDYAHNPDGYRQLCAFLETLPVKGRRILMFGRYGDRRERDIVQPLADLARHFDIFICRDFVDLRGRAPGEVPAMMQRGLVAAGVPAAAVFVEPDPENSLRFVLDLAETGDLVVLLVGPAEFGSTWRLLETRAQ